ncbi:MAG: carboxypeptidase M32 [Lachnospiraceae bacterium]|nr:carboxypeptidase M32 [Lachnospiraceae bacterium]
MTEKTAGNLKKVQETLAKTRIYHHAVAVLSYDKETICPEKGMEEQGELESFLGNEAFKLRKDPEFLQAAEELYEAREELDRLDRVLVDALHRDFLKTKNMTPEKQMEMSRIYNKAYVDWYNARNASDYSIFAPSLAEVVRISLEQAKLSEENYPTLYDHMLSGYELGMPMEEMDAVFEACKARLLPLLKKIVASPKKIRTDFLSREVTDEQQRKMSEYLLRTMDYDLTRGCFTTTEHPFTDFLGINDVRVTTHYYPTAFHSSIYSIVHEGGHALYGQLQPAENYDHFLDQIGDLPTSGQHESFSRFYENRIGRSREFIALIYPKAKEIFPQVFCDVTEEEFYEAMNIVEPSLIRTDADEFTYTLHIIIRYEIEKELILHGADVKTLDQLWKEKYKEYLGIEPPTDRLGILQDVHWTFGFGYFPTYAIGNFYNAMYYNRMAKEIGLSELVAKGDFKTINAWMAENVFKEAGRRTPKEWIREITGREFTPEDFLTYLEEKYGEIYGL